jgi:hypothetical protein
MDRRDLEDLLDLVTEYYNEHPFYENGKCLSAFIRDLEEHISIL